ncbi:MAG: hypothetical protein ACJ735_12175 [Actinomycetes bacterium]
MARIDPYEVADDDADQPPDAPPGRDADGVGSLRDAEADAGDEEEVSDRYDMDDREAREVGVQLDNRDEPEPRLD